MQKSQTTAPSLVLLAVRIPKDLHRRLKVHTAERGVSMASFVTAAIEAQLTTKRRA